ncbi:ECF transporter S component [Paramaledivibacter caminithermalis]|jgi:uncharacterized membrane protein|uniref:Uncharacterized membrane protein n=1 Tax=Paramaledivibacter caminithermalis (strain DSM 15212 / CIP 107654 / DViRD3) TaxID=1121301 RepID=A0A1M6M660_PARC5|nr:ECF transporter S component [Paramaledivibacter caminithermalis]SHJ78942.1 Uncharacterized membrane protein [Paramaledivibacter caminithermalis DSM 15212]
MGNISTKELTIMGLLTALVTVSTIAITIPIPATGGYLNLGDSFIFLAAIVFGWRYGLVAGGLGAALADLLVAPAYVIPTLIVKGVMGFIVGKIADNDNDNLFNYRNLTAIIIGAVWMALGYYIAQTIMLGNFKTPLVEFGPNVLQGLIGALIFFPMALAIKKSKILK